MKKGGQGRPHLDDEKVHFNGKIEPEKWNGGIAVPYFFFFLYFPIYLYTQKKVSLNQICALLYGQKKIFCLKKFDYFFFL